MPAPPSAPARLRASADIAAVFAARRSRGGRLAVVHHRPREDHEVTRVAVVASRRVGNAVRRNRAKRVLREAARAVTWSPGHDVVLTARSAAADAHAADVTRDVADAAARLDLVRAVAR